MSEDANRTRDIPEVTEGDAEPIENPEGFYPSAGEIGPNIDGVTCVP